MNLQTWRITHKLMNLLKDFKKYHLMLLNLILLCRGCWSRNSYCMCAQNRHYGLCTHGCVPQALQRRKQLLNGAQQVEQDIRQLRYKQPMLPLNSTALCNKFQLPSLFLSLSLSARHEKIWVMVDCEEFPHQL